MAASNPDDRFPPTRSNPLAPVNRPGELVPHYFGRHPEVCREEFLLDAVHREIYAYVQRGTGRGARSAPRERPGSHRLSNPLWRPRETMPQRRSRPPVTAEDIRIHSWLTERLVALHHERHGFWPKLRRLLSLSGIIHWLRRRPGI